jgi:hypothetical protein
MLSRSRNHSCKGKTNTFLCSFEIHVTAKNITTLIVAQIAFMPNYVAEKIKFCSLHLNYQTLFLTLYKLVVNRRTVIKVPNTKFHKNPSS